MRAGACFTIVSCLGVSLLGGCGGGSGGYSPPPLPGKPTVTITAPAQATTINLGQGVQVKWTTTDATSCAASTSSNIGGAVNSVLDASGTMTVAPIGTGNVTYTLTCIGVGGTAMATSATITVAPPILGTLSLASITTIGPTPDPADMGGNPYGLVIAPKTSGWITAGDLIVCNFNNGAGTEGEGTSLVGLHPTPGSTPYRIALSPWLKGCNALAMLPDDNISVAAWTANQNPLVAPDGTVNTPFSNDTFAGPWGEAFVPAQGQNPAALYVSNYDGSIDRITLNGDTQTGFARIASGFCGSGEPGSIYAPAGLTYDASIDTLYIVDTSSYSVVAFANISSIGTDGIVVSGKCQSVAAWPTPMPTFSGPSAAWARVIANGGGFVAPLSAALLADGDLIVTNSDINLPDGAMPNLAFEISPVIPGGFVGQPIQLDNGEPGALFGLATWVDAQGHQIVYFNDDNNNAVMRITQ